MQRAALSPVLIAALCICGVPATGAAAPLDEFSIRVGGFASRMETSLRFHETDFYSTTTIDFDDELALDEKGVVEYVGVSARPFERHQFDLDYFEQEMVGERTLVRDIEFEGERFLVNSVVRSTLSVRAIGFSYTYWPFLDEDWALGLRLGYKDYGLRAGIRLLVGTNGDPLERLAVARLDQHVPVPSIGLNYRLQLAPDWRLRMRIGWLEKRMHSVSPRMLAFGAGVDFMPWENIGAWVDIGASRIDASTRRETHNGTLRFDEGGVRVGVIWRF